MAFFFLYVTLLTRDQRFICKLSFGQDIVMNKIPVLLEIKGFAFFCSFLSEAFLFFAVADLKHPMLQLDVLDHQFEKYRKNGKLQKQL